MILRGPAIYSLSSFQGVAVPAGGSVGPSAFRWPRDLFVTGLLLVPRSGDPADLANLQLRIQDATYQDLIGDGQGASFSADGAALHGIAIGLVAWPNFRRFELQAPVAVGDEWMFTVTSKAGAPITLAGLYAYFDEGRQ